MGVMGIRRLKPASTRKPYETWQIDSLAELIRFVSDRNGDGDELLYRGQQSDWPLVPSVARIRVDREDRRSVERRMIDEFERTSVSHMPNVPADQWELMAIAQHYGVPTRLLDWTDSILTAAYFAVENPALPRRPGVIWMFTPIEQLLLGYRNRPPDPLTIDRPWVFRPRHFAPRVRAQGGHFTVHPRDSKHRFMPLELSDEYWVRMVQIVIAPGDFARIRWDLDSAGVNAGSLYPDLAGLGRRIRENNARKSDE